MGVIVHADSFFTIGKHHQDIGLPCQDYATQLCATNPKHPYIMACVSDGCSASGNSDLGSRIVSQLWKAFVSDLRDAEDYLTGEEFVNFWQEYAGTIKYHLLDNKQKDNEQALDATLLSVLYDANLDQISVHAYGDGYICTKYKSADDSIFWELERIEWGAGMPPYLSYFLNQKRRMELIRQSVGRPSGVETTTFPGGTKEVYPVTIAEAMDPEFPGYSWTSPRIDDKGLKILAVAVFSDGLGDFHHLSTRECPPAWRDSTAMEKALKFTEFKTLEGNFVIRRALKQLKEYHNWGIVPSDDFSMASLVFEED